MAAQSNVFTYLISKPASYFEELKSIKAFNQIIELFQKILFLPEQERNDVLSSTSKRGKPLLIKIITKSHECRSHPNPNYLYRNFPPLPPYEASPTLTISQAIAEREAVAERDIEDGELENLRRCLSAKRSKQQYRQLVDSWASRDPLPSELLNWDREKINHLFNASSFPSRILFVNRLNTLTDGLLANSIEAKREARELLEEAILNNHSNIVQYLVLDLNIDVNGINEKGEDLFSLAMINQNLGILKLLFERRTPISFHAFSEIVHQTLQNYLYPITIENEKKNGELLDQAVSSLLGTPNCIENLIKTNRSRYHGHIFELKEKQINIKEYELRKIDITSETGSTSAATSSSREGLIGDDLEGFHAHEYMWLHLRLFFQKIIETTLACEDLDERVLQEFLCELETGWLLNQYKKWLRGGHSADDQTRFVQEALIPYVIKCLHKLPIGSEYVLHTGLPRHTIYVSFEKLGNQQIRIRVDNLGGYLKSNYNQHIADVSIDLPELRKYLYILFNTTRQSRRKFTDTEKRRKKGGSLASKIYNQPSGTSPRLLPSPPAHFTYPSLPFQTKSGNCSHYSLVIGQCIRLKDERREFVLSLPEVLERLAHLYDPMYKSEAATSTQKIALHPTPLIGLRTKLLNQYMMLQANASPFLYMRVGIRGKISGTVHSDTVSEDAIISRQLQSPESRILVQADAGMGKTVYLEKLAYTLQSDLFQKATVLYLPLRHLANYSGDDCSLENLVGELIFHRKIRFYERHLLRQIIDDPKTIWILDGLDELVFSPHLQELLKTLFNRSRLLISSRPHFSGQKLTPVLDLNLFVTFEIKPYDQQEKIIDFYLAHSQFIRANPNLNLEKIKQILIPPRHFNANLSPLQSMCEIPLSLHKICQLLTSGNQEILTETNLATINNHFISHVLMNTQHKKQKSKSTSIEAIRAKYSYAIRYLEKLAFMSLLNERRTHFSLELTHQILPNDPNLKAIIQKQLQSIGFTQFDSEGGQFVHATYQEYFAASYLARRLKFDPKSIKFKEAYDFIKRHRNTSVYEYIFRCLVQIFQSRIQGAASRKKQDYIYQFVSFLNIFFCDEPTASSTAASSNETAPLSTAPKQFNPSLEFLGILCEIAEEEESIKAIIEKHIYLLIKSMLNELNFNNINYFKTLFSRCPKLKEEILIPLVPQLLDDVKASHVARVYYSNYGGVSHNDSIKPRPPSLILELMHYLKMPVPRSFLISLANLFFERQNTEPQLLTDVQNPILRFIADGLCNETELTPAEESTIHKLVSGLFYIGAVKTINFKEHIDIVERIETRAHYKITVIEHLIGAVKAYIAPTAGVEGNEYLRQLLAFIKGANGESGQAQPINRYHYLDNEFINVLISKPNDDTCKFLIDYILHLLHNDRDKNENITHVLHCLDQLFNSSNHVFSLDIREKLLELKKLSVMHQEHQELFNSIFKNWDEVILNRILEAKLTPTMKNYVALSDILDFLKNPPAVNAFVFKSGGLMKRAVASLADASIVSNKQKYCPDRPNNWLSISDFLADRRIVQMMDQDDPKHMDELMRHLLELCETVRQTSGLQSHLWREFCDALNWYQSPYDTPDHRITWLEEARTKYGHAIFTRMPESPTPARPLSTRPKNRTFDAHYSFSYHYASNYSTTLAQLSYLAFIEPKLVKKLITPEKAELESLRDYIKRRGQHNNNDVRDLNIIAQLLQISNEHTLDTCFDVDLSFLGYSTTLNQLSHLASKNLELVQQLITPEKRVALERLRSYLERDLNSISAIRTASDQTQKLRELNIIAQLLEIPTAAPAPLAASSVSSSSRASSSKWTG